MRGLEGLDAVPDERRDACDGEFARLDGVCEAMLFEDGIELDAVVGVCVEQFGEGFAVDRVSEMCRGEVLLLCGVAHFERVENKVYEETLFELIVVYLSHCITPIN